MANKEFILWKESQFYETTEEIKLTIRAIQRELDNNEGELYSENKEYWSTLYDNAYKLRGHLTKLLKTLRRSL